MPIGNFRSAGSGLFPLGLGVLLMILSLAYLLGSRIRHRLEEAPGQAPGSSGRVARFTGTIALSILLMKPLGYPLVSFLLILAQLRILGMKRWGFNAVIALSTAAVSYLLFVQWLKIPLPKGVIGL
jgi:hypothetical protein